MTKSNERSKRSFFPFTGLHLVNIYIANFRTYYIDMGKGKHGAFCLFFFFWIIFIFSLECAGDMTNFLPEFIFNWRWDPPSSLFFIRFRGCFVFQWIYLIL